MYLQHLRLTHFKNHLDKSLAFHPRFNCISGLNGTGKTNILDAIYFLCLTKSFLGGSDVDAIMHQQNFCRVSGSFKISDKIKEVTLVLQQNEKKRLEVNQSEQRKLSDYIGSIPLIIIAPSDSQLITGSSADRRKAIDNVLCQTNKAYLDTLIKYNKVLEQRNSLLKNQALKPSHDYTLLDIYSKQLSDLAPLVYATRKEFIKEIQPFFSKCYSAISSSSTESPGIEYQSDLSNNNFYTLLNNNLQADIATQRTTTGVHKDDFVFTLNGSNIKKFGSQGQQKTFILSFKLALYEYINAKNNAKALLLLDDIFDKLDPKRISSLLIFLSDNSGQVFITDSDYLRIQQLISNSIGNDVAFFTCELLNPYSQSL